MPEDADHARIHLRREAAGPDQVQVFQEAPGEAEAEAVGDAFLRGAGPLPAGLAAGLGGADAMTRARALSRLQQERGNAYVQRVVTELTAVPGRTIERSRGSARPQLRLQRQTPGAVKDKGAAAAPPSTGDVAIVTGYLGRQIDNWHEGARQGCEQFWKWSQSKPGVGKDFWFNLTGNVIWAVGNTTTAGLIGIGLGAMQTYISANAAQAKAESAEKIYNEVLTSINKARSAMMDEKTLETYASTALADATILAAVRDGRVKDWTPQVRSIANAPVGDSVDAVKLSTFTELLKRYWAANVSEVEVVYAAYQSQPMGINIGLDDWPEVARLIQQGDATWHIYKDKKIVGTQGGTRVEIPVDHPSRAKVEALVMKLEGQALKSP
jgi:hypothetical protein